MDGILDVEAADPDDGVVGAMDMLAVESFAS
jgi:hypothetical protein